MVSEFGRDSPIFSVFLFLSRLCPSRVSERVSALTSASLVYRNCEGYPRVDTKSRNTPSNLRHGR